MELEHQLRSASDDLMLRLERLRELEMEKRTLTPGTPRFRSIAKDIERLAASVLTKSAEQEQLARKSVEERQATGIMAPPIKDVAPKREVATILGEWREAERRLSESQPGTPEHEQAQNEIDRLREEYRDAYSTVSRANGEPPSR